MVTGWHDQTRKEQTMSNEIHFYEHKSLAGHLEPGDATRYEMVAVQNFDSIEVIVMNDGFFDKITFIPREDEPCQTFRREHTNPWTIKAAKIMRDKLRQLI
jgi:hypothetical protein